MTPQNMTELQKKDLVIRELRLQLNYLIKVVARTKHNKPVYLPADLYTLAEMDSRVIHRAKINEENAFLKR